jgi:hypothetical protein
VIFKNLLTLLRELDKNGEQLIETKKLNNEIKKLLEIPLHLKQVIFGQQKSAKGHDLNSD